MDGRPWTIAAYCCLSTLEAVEAKAVGLRPRSEGCSCLEKGEVYTVTPVGEKCEECGMVPANLGLCVECARIAPKAELEARLGHRLG